jgi:HlyD family secretion protein
MGRKLVRIMILIVAVALVAWLARSAGYWGVKPDTTLKIYGNVEVRETELAFRVPGRIEKLYVDEGDRVDAGALIAQLDSRPFTDAVANATADIGVVSAELQQQANGNRPQDIAQADAAVRQAKAMRDDAQRQYVRRSELLGKGFIPRAEVDNAKAMLDAADANVSAAEQALSLQRAGTRPDAMQRTRATESAAESRRRQAITSLTDTALYAPSRGIISTRVREAGTIVQPGEPVFTLTLDDPVRIRAFVAAPDLGRIKPGMTVDIIADGRAAPYRGTIGFISPAAEFTPKSVQTEDQRTDLVYRVRITVANPDGGLRQGQPVTVRLVNARTKPDTANSASK